MVDVSMVAMVNMTMVDNGEWMTRVCKDRNVYDGNGKHGEDEDKVEQSLFLTRHPSRPTPPSVEEKIVF